MDAASIISSPAAVKLNDEGSATISGEAKAIVGSESTSPSEGAVPPPVTPPPPPAPKEEEAVSPRFALLAKEEKRIQEERKRIAEERKNPEYQEYLEFKKMKAKAKEDPLSVMEKLGLSYDELTEHVISGKHTKDPSVRALEEKLAKMEADAKEREDKAKKDLETAQLSQYQEQIKSECLKSPDDFDLVNTWGAHNLVYNVIQEHYDNTEQVLTVQEAAKKVEAYLEQESQKYQGSKKLRKLFGAPDKAGTEVVTENKESTPANMSTTLSNSASTGTTSIDDDGELDPHKLVSKAAKLLMR